MAGIQSARAVKRIEDVRVLRTVQFPEDAGPMAHPVRPDSYIEINNFYTVTIYEKGAEVVRMMQTLVSAPGDEDGKQGFAKGMKLYFERHDGQAVTCDDFTQAISDANPGSPLAQRLPQFKRWYSQAGTPRVLAEGAYNSENKCFTLTLSQSCASTPDQAQKEPFVIPVSVGLLDAKGKPMAVQLQGDTQGQGHPEFSKTLVLSESAQSFVFENIESVPTPSLLRNFSAPVNLDCTLTEEQWLTLLAHDTDSFNRWEAGQRLAVQAALRFIRGYHNPQTEPVLGTDYLHAMKAVLNHPDLDSAFKELVLTLPSETYISEQLESVDPQQVHAVREAMKLQLAQSLQSDWQTCYEQNKVTGAYSPDAKSSGKRALSGMALSMLCLAAVHDGTSIWPGKALQAFKDAHNMTDRFNALVALVGSGHELAAQALAQFHALFKNEALVIDKWFGLQASTPDRGGNILPIVRQLMQHPDFNLRNPNRARSLIFSYCSANPGGFHRTDAAGYVYWSERVIELDAINPQVAASLARALDRWKKLAEPYRQAAKAAIERVAAKSDLSNDVREVVARALAE
jgi:aminopeptidase N